MSKTKRSKNIPKGGKKAAQKAKAVRHPLYTILAIRDNASTQSIIDYYKQTNHPTKLVLVGRDLEGIEEPSNISVVAYDWATPTAAFREGLASIEQKKGFVCCLYEQQVEAFLPAVKWFYSNKVEKTEKQALFATFNTSKGLNNLVHKVWSPIGSTKPLAHVNFCSFDLVEGLLAEEQVMPIEQTRALKNKASEQLDMPLDLATDQSFAADKIALIKQNTQLFFRDFIQSPLASFQETGGVIAKLGNGNHPLYRLAFLGLFLFFMVLMPLVSFDYGITWDEPVNVTYAEDIYNYYANDDQMVFNLQKRHARNATMHYGASFDFFAYLVQKYISPFGVYETRHFMNAIVGVLIALFVGRIGKEIGGWRLACIAFLFTALSPRFFGHSMNNHKDIPFMLGYAMSIYYLIRFVRELPSPRFSIIFWLMVGMAYGISIRIGGLLVIAYFGLFFGIAWLLAGFQEKGGFGAAFKRVPKYVLYGVVIVFASYLLGIVLWPYGFEKPFENPFNSLAQFTNFQFLTTYEVFNGERMLMTEPPADYIPRWVWITIPIVVIIGLFLSIPHLIHKFKKHDKLALSMLYFTMIFPVAYVIIKESTLYSGWRHVLFIYAPLSALAAFGWEYLFQLSPKKVVNTGVAVAMFGLLTLPAYWMVKNHPHQYVYFNEIVGGINGAYSNYETEYWPNANRKAMEWLWENGDLKGKRTVIATNFEVSSAQYYANQLIGDDTTTSVQILWRRENQKYQKDWDYAFFGSRTMSKAAIQSSYPPTGTIHTIKADTVPLVAIIKQENDLLVQAFQQQRARKIQEAMALVTKYLQYDTRNPEAYRLKGTLHLNIRQYDQAIEVFKKCIALDADDYSAYTLLGSTYRFKKDYPNALDALHKAIDLRVNNNGAYHQIGWVHADQQKYQESYKYFEQSLKFSNYRNAKMISDVALVQLKHAVALKANKQGQDRLHKQAIGNLKRVLQLKPNDQTALKNMAYAYSKLGDTATAKKYQALIK